MHITFLIGNGFDRNLGLQTAYSDFVKVYKTLESKSGNIQTFRKYIEENEEKWSAAEEQLGQYTEHLKSGQGQAFSECQEDFCVHLADYLQEQQKRVNFEFNKEKILKAFEQIKTLTQPFSVDIRTRLEGVYRNHRPETLYFDFINFNYTYTLDECLRIVKQKPGILGGHTYNGAHFTDMVGKVCHVHGTVEGEMVFGVNDESQIANPDIFNGNELGKKFLIKKETNESHGQQTDSTASEIIQASSIIYIYGMALGITDKLWWQRICKWLLSNGEAHVIIHQHEMPSKGVFQYAYEQYAQNKRREFMSLGDLTEDKWSKVESRIHITEANIFAEIRDIANLAETVTKQDENEFVNVG